MRVEQTHDMDLVTSIFKHDSIWPFCCEDGTEKEGFYVPDINGFYSLLVIENDTVNGVFWLNPITSVILEVHTCLLPHGRGAKANQAANLLVNWVFSNTKATSIVTRVPAFNEKARKLAERTGFSLLCTHKDAFMWNDRLYDMDFMGINKCQQLPPPQ